MVKNIEECVLLSTKNVLGECPVDGCGTILTRYEGSKGLPKNIVLGVPHIDPDRMVCDAARIVLQDQQTMNKEQEGGPF